MNKDDITTRSNSAAFSFFISLFPSMLFLLAIIPFLPGSLDLMSTLQSNFHGLLPIDAENALNDFIGNLVVPRGGLLSLSVVVAIYFASNGTEALMRGFEKHGIDAFRHRNWLERRLMAIGLTFILFFLLLVSVLMVVVGNELLNLIINYVHLGVMVKVAITLLRYFVVLFVLYTGISFLYKFGPSLRQRSRFFSPGALLATILCILTSMLFQYYVNNFSQYNQLYGAIGALIVIMLWLQIICFVILIGFELNASIAVGKYKKLVD